MTKQGSREGKLKRRNKDIFPNHGCWTEIGGKSDYFTVAEIILKGKEVLDKKSSQSAHDNEYGSTTGQVSLTRRQLTAIEQGYDLLMEMCNKLYRGIEDPKI